MQTIAPREKMISKTLFSALVLSMFAALFGPAVAQGFFTRFSGEGRCGYGWGYGFEDNQESQNYGYGFGYGYGRTCQHAGGVGATFQNTVVTPNGGEAWAIGSVHTVSWTKIGEVPMVRISVSYDGGGSYTELLHFYNDPGSFEWTVPNNPTTQARIRVESVNGDAVLASDASDQNFTIFAPAPEVLGESDTDNSAPIDPGTFIKLPSDNNKDTQPDSTVYFVGADHKAHPFMSQPAFLTWYTGFEIVQVVDAATLATYPQGSAILFRPGAAWIKTTSDNKVYYVAPGNVLRWISDEPTAVALGGADWAANVLDMNPSFMSYYTIGEPLTAAGIAAAWPDAFLGKDSTDGVWYVAAGKRRHFASTAAFLANKFQSKFVQGDVTGWLDLPTGTEVTGHEDGLYSLLP